MKKLSLLLLLLTGCAQAPTAVPEDGLASRIVVGEGSDAGAAFATFCEAYAATLCEREVRCGETASSGVSKCVDLALARCRSASVSLGYQTEDPDKAERCLRSLRSGCREDEPNCAHVLEGRVPSGGACLLPADCEDKAESCGGAGCSRTCQSAGGLGEPCRQDGRCTYGLRCDGTSGSCARIDPPGGVGADCSTLGQPQCDETTFCDFQDYKCAALPVAGEACRTGARRCTGSATCRAGMCEAKLDGGAVCSSSEDCVLGLYCDGTCQERRGGGSLCPRGDECYEWMACVSGTCAVPRTPGETCSKSSDCGAGLGCDGVTRVCAELEIATTVGASCSGDLALCAAPLRCAGFGLAADGGVGTIGSCAEPAPCACAPSERCVPDGDGSFSCEGLKGAEAPCSYSRDCQPPLICRTSAMGGMRCGALPGLGEACRITKGGSGPCLFPYECRGAVCVEAGSTGQVCLWGATCVVGGCDSLTETCGPGLSDGERCSIGSECSSGTCLRFECASAC